MDKENIIALLNKDLQDEHGAIIQYLTHAYAMGEGEIACEIEAIARDEMRHLDWLAEAIVGLGGIPNLERGKMIMEGKLVAGWMRDNTALEEGAIKAYQEHIRQIDDPKIKRVLERILQDEISHRDTFQHFQEKVIQKDMTDLRGRSKVESGDILNWGIAHEYTVVLQYLLHSYLAHSKHIQHELEDQAVNEMQHMGWLAEKMIDERGKPVLEHTGVYQGDKTADRLQNDIKIEKEVAAEYDRAARESNDPALKKLLTRIRDHELYHIDVFHDLLKEADKEKK